MSRTTAKGSRKRKTGGNGPVNANVVEEYASLAMTEQGFLLATKRFDKSFENYNNTQVAIKSAKRTLHTPNSSAKTVKEKEALAQKKHDAKVSLPLLRNDSTKQAVRVTKDEWVVKCKDDTYEITKSLQREIKKAEIRSYNETDKDRKVKYDLYIDLLHDKSLDLMTEESEELLKTLRKELSQ